MCSREDITFIVYPRSKVEQMTKALNERELLEVTCPCCEKIRYGSVTQVTVNPKSPNSGVVVVSVYSNESWNVC